VRVATLAGAALLAVAIVPATAARAEDVVNVTLNIPADPRPNPCTGDLVSLSGTMHIVYYVRSDQQGGFHVNQLVDEKLSGQGVLSGDGYQGNDSFDHSWYARPPFPTTDTVVHQVVLASRSGSDNFLMRYRLHTTIAVTGVPTARMSDVALECTG
jgi:hypothetical protein